MDIRSVKRNYSIQQWKSIIQNRNNSGMTVDAEPDTSMVTAVPIGKAEPSQLILSINGIMIHVTENTSSALLARTIGVIKNA